MVESCRSSPLRNIPSFHYSNIPAFGFQISDLADESNTMLCARHSEFWLRLLFEAAKEKMNPILASWRENNPKHP